MLKTTIYSILILSCDKNLNLLEKTVLYFKKYFPVEIDIYVGLENKQIHSNDFFPLYSSSSSFSSRLIDYVSKVSSSLLFLLLDDFVLENNTNFELFNQALDLFKEKNTVNVSFTDFPDTSYVLQKKIFTKRTKKTLSIFNYQAGLWKKDFLLKILRPNENPWQSEVFGSIRTWKVINKYNFYSTNKVLFYNKGWLVVKGQLNYKEYERLNSLIGFSFNHNFLKPYNKTNKSLLQRIKFRLNLYKYIIFYNLRIYK